MDYITKNVENILRTTRRKIGETLSIKKGDRGYDINNNLNNVIKNIIGLILLIIGIYILINTSRDFGLLICLFGIIILSYNAYWKNIIEKK